MKGMKKNVALLLAVVLVGFAALGGYFFYAVTAYGTRWFSTPYNTRLQRAKSQVYAGSIYDRSAHLLVRTGEDGSREYPVSETAKAAMAQLIGDVNGAVPTGAESMFANYLLGFQSSLAERFSQLFSGQRVGDSIQLTVDIELQKYAYQLFPEGKRGGAVLYNYKTGEIYCLYSTPGIDLDDPTAGLDEEDDGLLLNRITQGRYAPGSVFKIVTLACALEYLPDVMNRSFHCEGSLQVTEEVALTDTDGEGHGDLTFGEAFAKSCNIAFGQLALELGQERLAKTARAMGFDGNFLFSDLIVYESLFPDSIADEGELAWTGVGQGKLMVNPMHMALIVGSVANDGQMVEPQLLLGVVDSQLRVTNKLSTKVYTRTMSASVAKTIQELMIQVVESGTGSAAAVEGYTIGGKTGTAQVNSSGGAYQPHSWYVGFCADEEAPFAVCVVVENGGSGSGSAARLAGDLMERAIERLAGDA